MSTRVGPSSHSGIKESDPDGRGFSFRGFHTRLPECSEDAEFAGGGSLERESPADTRMPGLLVARTHYQKNFASTAYVRSRNVKLPLAQLSEFNLSGCTYIKKPVYKMQAVIVEAFRVTPGLGSDKNDDFTIAISKECQRVTCARARERSFCGKIITRAWPGYAGRSGFSITLRPLKSTLELSSFIFSLPARARAARPPFIFSRGVEQTRPSRVMSY